MEILYEILLYLTWYAGVTAITISPTASQVINGIGASGAWWPIDLYKFPDDVKTHVADLLFGSSGLRLTSFRYNLGGGGVFVGNPSRAPETPFVSPGVYNFSADPQGVYFLRKAAEANMPIITLFVNSAPPLFTSNNRSCGGTIVNSTIQDYLQYVTDVISFWRSQSVNITHVSPMNEPDNGFDTIPFIPCNQEGMIVTPEQRAFVVNTLRRILDDAGLQDVGIVADESSTTSNFLPEAASWIPSAKDNLSAISHHQYGFADDGTVAQMGSTGRNLSGGKETWFTEICCFGVKNPFQFGDPAAPLTYFGGFDPTMVGGLQMANLIYQSFTQALDAHFDWWLALSSSIGCDPTTSDTCITSYNLFGWNDGLLYYDRNAASNGNFAIYTTKRYYVLKHFSQFIEVGAIRHSVEDILDPVNLRALAFQTSSGWSIIVLNLGSATASFVLPMGLGRVKEVFQTSPTADWASVEAMQPPANVSLPGLSITSFLFPGI